MYDYLILLIINIFYVCFSYETINDNINISSNINFKKDSNYIEEKTNTNRNKIRNLQSNDDGFKNIRIFIDKTYINQNFENIEILNKVLSSIEKCAKSIQEIIKVKQIDKIKFTNSDLQTLGFNNTINY